MAQEDGRHCSHCNDLLAALPTAEFALLMPRSEHVEVAARQILHGAHAPIRSVYFPTTGVISLIARLERGGAIEVGMIGREGMVGLPLALGIDSSPEEALAQTAGTALRIGADAFREVLAHTPTLRALLLRYEHVLHTQVAQTAACNGRHLLEARLARWLLMAHDRLDANELPFSQELLATMLGVRRAGVTVAAGVLQRAGAASFSRGRVVILNRRELERVSCECYAAVRQEYERLRPPTANAHRTPAVLDRSETPGVIAINAPDRQ
jgi:CRP-like cAMP-binding protein